MIQTLKKFKFVISSLLVSFFIALSIFYLNFTKISINEDDINLVKSNTLQLVNKLLISVVKEKYALELAINIDYHNTYLTKIISENRWKRNQLIKEINKVLANHDQTKFINSSKNNIVNINSEIDKLFNEASLVISENRKGFEINDWSIKANDKIDDIEKLIDSLLFDANYKEVIASNMAKVIINCYKQIFLISMYAYESSNIDELGQLMFFGYERDINMFWQKVKIMSEINMYTNNFIDNFKNKYFGPFVKFRNSFLTVSNTDKLKLFKEYNLIVKDSDEFLNEAFVNNKINLKLNNTEDMLILLLIGCLIASICLIFILKPEKVYLQNSSIDDLTASTLSVKENINIGVKNANIVAEITKNVRNMAIKNHIDLNDTYSIISKSINNLKEKLNSLVFKNSKLEEVIFTNANRCSTEDIIKQFRLAKESVRALQNIKNSFSNTLYKEVDDAYKNLKEASCKSDVNKNIVDDLMVRVDKLTSTINITDQNSKENIIKMQKSIFEKLGKIKQYSDEIIQSNKGISDLLKISEQQISLIASNVESVTDFKNEKLINIDESNLIKITNDIKQITKEHLESSSESISAIDKLLVVFKESSIHLINSMSSFKDSVIERIESSAEIREAINNSKICCESKKISENYLKQTDENLDILKKSKPMDLNLKENITLSKISEMKAKDQRDYLKLLV